MKLLKIIVGLLLISVSLVSCVEQDDDIIQQTTEVEDTLTTTTDSGNIGGDEKTNDND